MKRIFAGILLLIILAVLAIFLWYDDKVQNTTRPQTSQSKNNPSRNSQDIPLQTVIAEALDTPWAIAFLPDGNILVTERPGRVQQIDIQTGNKNQVAQITAVRQIGEGGLHGITLHPDFETNKYVYVYYTYSGSGNNTANRVSRFTYTNNSLTDEKIVVDAIPGAANHDGGRIAFGPDNFLYITTGDAQEPSLAQNRNSLAGKILRVTDEGKAVAGNPFNNQVYSYGHRNPQGICWDENGQLFSTEHGPSGIGSGYDELNQIRAGVNYGWPEIQGEENRSGMQTPFLQSGGSETWAPAGAACIDNHVYFGGLRGQTLYKATVQGDIVNLTKHFGGELGRIRAVVTGPDNMLYISTSNRDGRGIPKSGDDKILRINPTKL